MRKIMWFALGFALAAVIGMYCLWGSAYFPAAGVAAFILALSIWLQRKYTKVRIATAIMLGCVVGFCWMFLFDSIYLSVPRAADGKRISMTITATDYSQTTDYGVRTEGIGKLNGKIYKMQLYLPEGTAVSPGDQISGRFLLRATLPGCTGTSGYQSSDHTFLTAKISRQPTIDRVSGLPWYGYPAMIRQNIKQVLQSCMPEKTAGFSIALLIGQKDGLDYETDTAFKVSGISHIIAVSGLHVTILFSLVYLLVWRKRWLSMIVGLPVLLVFAAVAGFTPSIVRACIMQALMVIAMVMNKEYDPPTALGFAVLVMLVADPWTVTSVSFQLSVACMAGIFLFTEPIQSWLMDRKRLGRWKGRKHKLANAFSSSVGMSLGATILVTPLCAYYFKMVSLVGVLTNLLTLWIITFVFYGVMAVYALGLVWLPMGKAFAMVVAWPIRYVLLIAKVLSAFPLAAVYMDSIYMVLWLVFVYVLLAVFIVLKKKQVLILSSCAAIGLCLGLVISWAEPQLDECRVTVLDVGQGQCIILQSEGKTFVVDCGGDSDTKTADIAANALMSQGIFKIDGLILTHYDRDHAAGAQYLLTRVPTRMLYPPDCMDADGIGDTLSRAFSRSLVTERTQLSFGNCRITLIPSKSDLSDNESGLCVLFQTKNCDILITGDRSAAGERELLRMIDLPKLEVLIVGHHGSKNSTGQYLLHVTRPEIAIISAGQDNSYGHPSQEVLDRLEKAGCKIYRTDLQGTVIYRG